MEDPRKVVLKVEIYFNGKRIIRTTELGPSMEHEQMPMSAAPIPIFETMETVVAKMKNKEYSKKTIQAALSQLGYQISNELEDAYGWHGENRKKNTGDRVGLSKY